MTAQLFRFAPPGPTSTAASAPAVRRYRGFVASGRFTWDSCCHHPARFRVLLCRGARLEAPCSKPRVQHGPGAGRAARTPRQLGTEGRDPSTDGAVRHQPLADASSRSGQSRPRQAQGDVATGPQQVPEAGSPQASRQQWVRGQGPTQHFQDTGSGQGTVTKPCTRQAAGCPGTTACTLQPVPGQGSGAEGWGHAAGWQPSPPALREHPAPCQELPGSAATQQEY